ncbi:STNB-like protein [Mya arenaria]|uniref:STNB-like protein n=1 Tax=Mya arenaria TaxID=6604 RepID=A0ABY7FAW8_MYAAR|nr:STNB-like protein [Mya arenaria]
MSKQSFDDSSNLVDIPALTDGDEKKCDASGNTSDLQPDLLSFDDPEPSDLKEHLDKPKSKKSKAKRLFKRAKSPISGAFNKTKKEFEKLSNLPKHHYSSSPKSPTKSPSKENLTEEYSKLEKKLSEKTSEEWLQFQQMQDRIQQSLHKTKSTLSKLSSESEDNEGIQSKPLTTRWTGFEDDSGLEPEVIDTSLNPRISITGANDSELKDSSDLVDTGTDENILIDTTDESSQPVSPARRKVPEKPKDHFGFVKKALKPGEKEDNEEEDGYKPLATLSKKKESEELKSDIDEADDELFGLEPGTAHIDSGIDDFFASSSDSRTQNDAELAKDQAKGWVDPTAADIVDFGADLDTDTAWDDSHIPVEKKPTVCVWGGEQEAVLVDRGEDSNPFQDDFSKFDEVPALQGTGEAANPFMITDNVEVNVSTANPFFDFGDDKTDDTDGRPDLVGGKAHPATLSDSESFFLDSVADTKQGVEAIDDVFDPFNVTSKSSSSDQNQDSSNAENSESLDHFSSVAASGDKQLAKPSDDDDHSFMLDIKPVTSEKLKTDSLPIAPAIAPPPKAPKSPQPPRINPFDRESPAEEDFAQFDVKDKQKEKDGEKPKEQNEERLPTSMSMESETTTEEEDENLEPLEPFLPECDRDSFKLMLRYPTKKKIAGNRYWKNVCVKIEKQKDGIQIRVLNDARDALPIQELLLQPCYSLSDISLQQYDQYGYHSYSKKHGQFPCEDIEVRFPIPEVWIYMFRYERRFGYGSVHSAARKPGKIKGAYTSHLFRLKLELGPHDEFPESFETHTSVSFTMPCSTVSQSQIRSIAVTNQNPPEKWVRSSASYEYRIEIEHLDEYPELMAIGSVYKEAARPSLKPEEEEKEERDPRLAQSDSDSSDSD